MTEFTKAKNELLKARAARQNGLEGRARVLCRMAAASGIKAHLTASGAPLPSSNIYELILNYSQEQSLPPPVAAVLGHLLMRVDEDHNLPDGIDLISDTEQLLIYLESHQHLQEKYESKFG